LDPQSDGDNRADGTGSDAGIAALAGWPYAMPLQPRRDLRVDPVLPQQNEKDTTVTDPNPYPPVVAPAQTAFFFDVDGTLAEIVTDPAKARVAPPVLAVLDRLAALAGGALALVSGRSVAQIDNILDPLVLPAVGVHGLEKRLADGQVTRDTFDAQSHAALARAVAEFADSHTGLQAEPKPGAVALHFRNRPDLADACALFMQDQSARDPQLTLLTGKMVLELVLGRQSKGSAVASLMTAAPYAGRRPFFAGDDVTDETAFARVNALGGISVKVGAGATCALYRVPDHAALVAYLGTLAQDRAVIGEHSPQLDV
jgi:trehalose 6-phosphate phosphatase